MPVAGTTDEALLEQYLNGSQESLAELVNRHTPMLRVYILAKHANGDEDMTDDVIQQTFVRLMEAHETYNRRMKLRPWLFSLAANICIDMKRANSVRFAFSLNRTRTTNRGSQEELSYDAPDEAMVPAGLQVIAGEDASRVRAALETLSGDDRAAIKAIYFEQMSFVEASEHLDIAIGSLKTRIHRSLTTLRYYFGDDHPCECQPCRRVLERLRDCVVAAA